MTDQTPGDVSGTTDQSQPAASRDRNGQEGPKDRPAVRFAPSEDQIAGAVSRLDRALLWPKLLAVPRLALVPGSVGLALFATVLLALVNEVSLALLPSPDDGSAGAGLLAMGLDAISDAALLTAEGLIQGQLSDLRAAADSLAGFAAFAAGHPLNAIMTAVPSAFIAAIFGVGIARIAAVDVSIRQRLTWTDALALGLASARSGGLAILSIPALVAVAALVLATAGKLMLTLPGLNLIGGVFYGLFLLLGAIAAFALIGYLIAGPLMVPAVACDDADGFDAVQRAYAYLVASPLRLLAYAALAIAIGALFIGLLTALATAAVEMTSASAWAFNSGERFEEIRSGEANGTWAFLASAIRLWEGLAFLLVASIAVSYFFSASTLAYLLVRQAVDGQSHTEIYNRPLTGARVREPVEQDDG